MSPEVQLRTNIKFLSVSEHAHYLSFDKPERVSNCGSLTNQHRRNANIILSYTIFNDTAIPPLFVFYICFLILSKVFYTLSHHIINLILKQKSLLTYSPALK